MTAEVLQFPITVSGTRTRVLEAGEGERCLLFVHGLGARADRWRRNLGAMAALGYRCIAIDLPGHGLASKGTDIPATVPALAEFTASVAQALQLRDVVLVGTSLGGHILGKLALDWLEAAPAPAGLQPRGLMLIGTLGLFPLDPAVAAAIRRSVVETTADAIQRKVAFVLKVQDHITPAWLREEFMMNNSAGAQESLQRLGDYLVAQPETHIIGRRLPALARRIPLSVLWGAQDQAVPVKIGDDAQRELGLPAPVLIEGAGHAPYWERDDVFNPLLAAFARQSFSSHGGA
ncbi:MAG: alpha/beta fold hydrolase [Betaproteobacteria bacterium]